MAERTLRYGREFRRWVLLAMVFGVPVVFLWGVTYDPFNVPKLALLSAATGFAAATYVIEWAFGGLRRPGSWALIVPAGFIALPLTLSWILSPYKAWSLLGEYTRYEGLIPYLAIVAAGLFVGETFRERPLQPAWALVLSGTVVATYALVQALGLDPFDMVIDLYVPSTVGHGNFVGGFLAVTLPISVSIWGGSLAGHRMALVCTIVIAVGVLVSFSQGGLAAALAGIALTSGLLARRRFRLGPSIGMTVVVAVVLFLLGYVTYAFVAPTGPLVDGTARARAHWWKAAINMAADSPFVGHGPNVYAIESPVYRTPLDAVAHGSAISDGPHSVPMSMLANAGLLGLAGYLLTIVWAFLRANLRSPGRAIRAGFAGGVAAYFVQSLVSFDQVLLAFALWVSLAGLVAATSPPPSSPPKQPTRRGTAHRIVALIVAPLLLLGILTWAGRFLISDARVHAGVKAFERDDVDGARTLLHQAIAFNNHPAYRRLLGDGLGRAASARGRSGKPLLDEMSRAFSYIERVPMLSGILGKAHWLHLWSVFDLEAEEQAVELLRQAVLRDPYNPQIRTQLAEALLHLNRPHEAEVVLDELVPVMERYAAIRPFYPSIWALLAITKDQLGDSASASIFLERARTHAEAMRVQGSNCHVLLARVRVGKERSENLNASLTFFCSPVIQALVSRDSQ